ncbi:MAG: RidA family protein [Chloroflexi bacterium]|nr:RidA family protein [Chloroflexota bacterium]
MQKRFFYLNGRPFVFLSTTGYGVKGATEEATAAFDRLNRELQKLGGSIEDVVRTTVFTRDQECRPAVSEVRKNVFPLATRPASSSIIVHDFSPFDTLIEVDATAFLSRGNKYRKKGYEFDPPRPYIKAVEVEDVIFVSGQTGRGEDYQAQARSACNGIGQILSQLGAAWDKVVMVSCYLQQIDWFETVHRIVLEKTGKPVPVDMAIGDEYAGPEMRLEIEVTAVR